MGLCLSKKQQRRQQQEQPRNAAKKAGKGAAAALAPEAKKAPAASRKAPPAPRPEEPAADKRTVFVVKAAAAAAAAEVAKEEASGGESEGGKRAPAAPVEEAKPAVVSRVPVRTSSCTKEEVDAILIQCGRLSRSSSASGKAAGSGESGGGHRRYSGSKRSYDFDRERRGGGVDEECDWDRHGGAAASRPSPRRRTPDRKRSASHESRSGAGSGSRRVSRSPGRRDEVAPAAAAGSVGVDRAARQPGKMVSVPAREKGRAPSPVKAAPAPSGKRYASPTLRSNSPARAAAVANENAGVQAAHGPSLSRSSSRKADHSPYRRNPMSELDENALVNNHHAANSGKLQKKPIESVAAVSQRLGERCAITKDKPEIMEEAVASDTKAPSARMNATHTVSIVSDSVVNNTRAGPGCRSSRRSSRDFDHSGSSFAFMEDAVAPSSKINATHSVNFVAESVANPKAGRSSRRSSRDFDHNGSSVAFLNDAMASEPKAPSSRMNAMHTVSIVAESIAMANPKAGPAGRSSRRSSRDFDHNGNSYASLLLEDIQSYHQQNASDTAVAAPAFSLPACVSKACSILEAVADLNSSPSENRSFELDRSADDKGSANVSCYSAGKAVAAGTHVVESEVVVKDDLMEPSLHKYVSVRDIRAETEPQESAGSNSFAGNPWTCSWEPNSVDSTDRTWTASQSNSDDVEQGSGGTVGTLEQSWQSKPESGGRPRLGSAGSAQLGRGAHRGGVSDVRTASANSSSA